MPDSIIGIAQFGADHYRPQSQHPELATEYANLFYCCNACNSRKGDAPPKGTPSTLFIPNPCDHVMYSHVRYKHSHVEHVSKAGQYTIELLDLNEESILEHREDVLHIIDVLENSLSELKTAEKNLVKKKKAGQMGDMEFTAASAKIAEFRAKSQRALDRHTGKFA